MGGLSPLSTRIRPWGFRDMAPAPVPREKRHRFVLWGGKDSNLRSTDYESRRNPSMS